MAHLVRPPEWLLCAIVAAAPRQAAPAAPAGGAGPGAGPRGFSQAQLVPAVQQQPGCSELTEADVTDALQYVFHNSFVYGKK
jgi:hypothetical protein